MEIIISVLWLSIGIAIAYHSLWLYLLYLVITWAIFTVIEAKKTTGGKGVNRPVDKGSNPFK